MNNKALLSVLSVVFASGCDLTMDNEPAHNQQLPVDLHNHEQQSTDYFTCSMHPNVKQSKPGRCPFCSMTLTKVTLDEDSPVVKFNNSSSNVTDKSSQQLETVAHIKLRQAQVNHFKASLFKATTMVMTKSVRLLGTVLQSEDRQSTIPARVAGRVEKVFIQSTGSLIQKGDPVISLYSPKLITAGEEYLVARRSYQRNRSQDFKQLMRKSEERLRLWGIRGQQIESWFTKGVVPRQITLFSEATGIVRKHSAKVGRYFQKGHNYFELSDLSELWIELDVYEHDAGVVKIGQKVEMEFTASPGTTVTGQIDFINPILDTKSRTLKVRTTVDNTSGTLKPGMIAEATLTIEYPGNPIVVPRSAIINTGRRKVLWLQSSGHQYRAITVKTGFEAEGFIAVTQGLSIGDKVVTEGNFLLDAQAQLTGSYQNNFIPDQNDY